MCFSDGYGISADLRDSFVDHAVNFDLDDNGYLKKAELEEAAKAWNADNSSEEAEEKTQNLRQNLPKKKLLLMNRLRKKPQLRKHVLYVQHHVHLMQIHVLLVDSLS